MIRPKRFQESDEPETRVLTNKEVGRLLRRKAYQRAKEQRAKDPRIFAMKEAAKQQRRALYQKEKERRKAARAEAKAQERARKAQERAAADFELMKMIKRATKGSTAEN